MHFSKFQQIVKQYSFVILSLFIAKATFSQTPYPGCPNVDAPPDDINLPYANGQVFLDCGQTCVDLTATFLTTGTTSNYIVQSVPYAPPFSFTGGTKIFVGSDDVYTDEIDLPFDFCFYENTYDQIAIGANGLITFDMSLAGNFNCYTIANPIPNANNSACAVLDNENMPHNSIYGAFHDMDPTKGNPNINYSILGTAPCRTFVVNWSNVPHFSCNNLITTQQIVIYETTNVIEVYIKDKPSCAGWNGGRSVIGIQNQDGTNAVAPPGRNTSVWSTNNEAWRFTPDGPPNYVLSWYDETGTKFSNSEKVNICIPDPNVNSTYKVEVEYSNCNGDLVLVESEIEVIARPDVTLDHTFTDATCKDSCNGSATITPLTGSAPFTYNWPFGVGNATETGLCAGNYTVNVVDDKGCEEDITITIGEPPALITNTNATDALCNGSLDGTAEVVTSGGTPTYDISWSNGATTASTTMGAGKYYVEITDQNLCVKLDSVEIAEPNLLVLDTNSTQNLSCIQNQDGEINAFATGGTGPYTFSLNGGTPASNSNFTNLNPGSYTIVLEDKNGCTDTKTYTLTTDSVRVEVPNDITVCKGDQVTLNATGYFETLVWDNGISNNSPFVPSHLGDLVYTATATNKSGCSVTDEVVVRVEDVKDPTITPIGPFCTNDGDVQISTAEAGGTWSGTGVDANGLFSPAAAGVGTHEVRYTFPGFCMTADTIQVAVNNQFDAAINPVAPICELADPITLTSVTPGGIWTGPGIANPNFSDFDPGLAGPGTVRVYHLIDNTCGDYDSLDIQVIAADVADIPVQNEFCPEGATQLLTATPTGGSWEVENYIDAAGNFDPNTAGTGSYQVVYTPSGNCFITDTAYITVVDTLKAFADSVHLACKGDMDATLTTTYAGGQGSGYRFFWENIGYTTPTQSNLGEGTYKVVVEDAIGCKDSVIHQVTAPNGMSFTQSEDVTHPSCFGAQDGSIQVYVTGGNPSSSGFPYNVSITPNVGTRVASGYTDLPDGNYVITVADLSGCSISTQTIAVTQPNALAVTATINTAYCFQSDGSVVLNSISGGTAPYTFYWDGTLVTDTHKINAAPGNYALKIIDNQACELDSIFTVPNSGSPDVTASMTPVTCFGFATGQASATGSGGTPGYTYTWDNGMTGANISGLTAGQYIVTLTDNTGCRNKDTVQVTEPSKVLIDDVNDTTMCVGTIYTHVFNASGGNPGGYTYAANNGTPTGSPNFSVSSPNTFTIVARDVNNCESDPVTFTISYLDTIKVFPNLPDSVCPGDAVTFSANATGGLENFTYTWSKGGVGQTVSYPSTGNPDTVTVTVTDGCSTPATGKSHVRYFPIPTVNPVITPLSGCEPLDVNFQLADQNFQSLTWNIGNGTVIANQLTFNETYQNNGDYPVSIDFVSKNGCVGSYSGSKVQVDALPDGVIKQTPSRLTVIDHNGLFYVDGTNNIDQVRWSLLKKPRTDTIFQILEPGNTLRYTLTPDTASYVFWADLITPFGCKTTINYPFTVYPEKVIFIPSAFTPNQDGINDVFTIEHLFINEDKFTVAIYNRWGEEIFVSSDPNFKWDGVYDGVLAPTGIYTWKINYYSVEDKQEQLHGKVHLIR